MSWEDNTDATSVAFASQASLARFHSTFPCLCELTLIEPLLHGYEVAALCTHPALRKLAVRLVDGEHERTAFERLALDYAARGLTLMEDYLRSESYTLFDSSWTRFGCGHADL